MSSYKTLNKSINDVQQSKYQHQDQPNVVTKLSNAIRKHGNKKHKPFEVSFDLGYEQMDKSDLSKSIIKEQGDTIKEYNSELKQPKKKL